LTGNFKCVINITDCRLMFAILNSIRPVFSPGDTGHLNEC
jgi:hypothetical protein